MKLRLTEHWINRHGEVFAKGSTIDFGRTLGNQKIRDESAELVSEGEVEGEVLEEDKEVVSIHLKVVKGFKMRGKSYKIEDTFYLSDDNQKVIEKLISEEKVIVLL
tara:strand:- start:1112 stop:1429 length:318 start_codon:yes stop_codon:yes gene_type:complete